MSYKNGQYLGCGSFGHVWKFKSLPDKSYRQSHPWIALKRIQDPDQNAYGEVEVLKNLKHDYIVKYLEHFRCSNSGDLCIVFEFCDWGTLTDFLKTGNPGMSEFSVWRIICHLSSAIEYLHGKKIMHRDLKPDNNILVKTTGTDSKGDTLYSLKICDFGIAKLLNKKAQELYYTRTFAGTPIYMAPEVLSGGGDRYTTTADMWSLGAVVSAFCYKGTHLFMSERSVFKWPEEKSRNAIPDGYSKILRDLIANLLQQTANYRPSAAKVHGESQKDNRQRHDIN